MKPLSLSVVLAAALASPAVNASATQGPEGAPPAPDASSHVIPALYTPATLTSAGREFVKRCDDDAFAKADFPKSLASECEDLLRRWHWEARTGRESVAEAPRIPNYADALRSSTSYATPMGGL